MIPTGLTLTQAWSTANSLDSKAELEDVIAKGLKSEIATQFKPDTQALGAKVNFYFKQPNFHARSFFDPLKGPTANIDAVLGHEGFAVGAEAGYDVQKAAITKYSAAVGYTQPEYSAAITATNNLSVFAASYYHKVNSEVEAGAKATWDSKAGNNVGLELASKYRLDPSSFAKVNPSYSVHGDRKMLMLEWQAKVNDRGIAALAYNVILRPGVTFGVGMSLDTQNMKEGSHKVFCESSHKLYCLLTFSRLERASNLMRELKASSAVLGCGTSSILLKASSPQLLAAQYKTSSCSVFNLVACLPPLKATHRWGFMFVRRDMEPGIQNS